MHRLAKLGFTQSYTYFTWRNTKRELTEYFTELTRGTGAASTSGRTSGRTRPTFCTRRCNRACAPPSPRGSCSPPRSPPTTASTDRPSSSWRARPASPGSEEYLDSEKYQLRHWTLDRPDSLRSLIARINRIRRDNAALQSDRRCASCTIDNEQLIAYVKSDESSGQRDHRGGESRSASRAVGLDRSRPASPAGSTTRRPIRCTIC